MRKFVTLILVIFLTSLSFSQNSQQFANLGQFKLENGKIIKNCKIGYRTYGKINSDSSNVILFPTWFGGISKHLAGLVGADKLIDSTKFFVITVDALGDGVSSSPSNSIEQPHREFPQFSIRDMVNSQHEMLTKFLHINHLYAVVGGSMGGMQTFEWIVSYPGFMDKAVPYVGSTRLASVDLLLWEAEMRAIEEGWKNNASNEDMAKTVAAIQTYALRTPEYYVENVPHEKFYDFLKNVDKGFENIFNSYDWASQLHAMLVHDVSKPYGEDFEKAAARVKAKVLVIVSQTDHIVNPTPALNFAKMINADVFKLENNCGHLAPGCEMDKFSEKVRNFLNK